MTTIKELETRFLHITVKYLNDPLDPKKHSHTQKTENQNHKIPKILKHYYKSFASLLQNVFKRSNTSADQDSPRPSTALKKTWSASNGPELQRIPNTTYDDSKQHMFL